MVKPEQDATIDYYALLEISIRASSDEIKKQYRKLGAVLAFLKLMQRLFIIPIAIEVVNRLQ